MSLDVEALEKLNKEYEERQKALIAENEKIKAEYVPIEELRKVRAEAAENRKKYQEIASPFEQLSQENEKLKAGMDRIKKETAVMSAAMLLGFNDPSDAVRLVGIEAIEIKDDKIDSDVVKSMIEGIVKDKPYLVKAGSSGSFGPTNPAGNNYPHARPELTTQNGIDKMKQMAIDLTKQGRVAEATKLYNKAWEAQFGFKPLESK